MDGCRAFISNTVRVLEFLLSVISFVSVTRAALSCGASRNAKVATREVDIGGSSRPDAMQILIAVLSIAALLLTIWAVVNKFQKKNA